MQQATFYKVPKTSVFQQQLMVMMKKYKKSLFEISSVIHYWRFQIIEFKAIFYDTYKTDVLNFI